MKNFLFIYPPYCFPISPYVAPSLLSSILNENGFNSYTLDLNAKYYNKILNKDYLFSRFDVLKNNLFKLKNNNFNYTDISEQDFISKSLSFLYGVVKKEEEIIKSINNIDKSVDILKSEDFYDINKFEFALNCVQNAEKINLYSYFFNKFLNNKVGFSFNTLNYFVKNKKINPFYDFFLEQINNGVFNNYDYIMISQSFDVQTFATWTLAYLLKKYTKVKVVLGGNYPSRLTKTFESNNNIFNEYFDYILTGLGQDSIIEFAKFVNINKNPNNVPGLIYIDDNIIKHNKPNTFLLNPLKRTNISFDGIDFCDYLAPEVVIALQVSNGCPWQKCTFCVFHEGKSKFQIVPPKQIANEFKYLNEKYGITKFEFADESLSPNYYFELAKEILNLNLNISYYGFARFDDGFTPEILETMYKSGFKIFEWGYETPSKRIMEIYNKGINIDSRLEIMKRANDAGIWNHCLTIADLPFETKEEILYDYDVYLNNLDIFNSRTISAFALYKNAPIFNNANKYNMVNIVDYGDLSIRCKYKRKIDSEIDLDSDIIKKKNKLYSIYLRSTWKKLLRGYDEYLLLYVAKYGLERNRTGKF